MADIKKFRISAPINLHFASKDDIGEYIRKGILFNKSIGFDALDFNMNILHLMGEDWHGYFESSADFARENDIRFELSHLPFGINFDCTEEQAGIFTKNMLRAIDAAKILGVDFAVLHPNMKTLPLADFDYKKSYDTVMTHLSPFADYAAKRGLNIVIENMRSVPDVYPVHRYCGQPDELCEIADALGIGICWDFGHANICKLVQSEALKYVGKKLKMIHVNDNFAYGDDHIPPFCGSVDWKDAMHGLAEAGYTGLFNFEVSTRRQPANTREYFAKYLMETAHALIDMIV